MIKKEYTAPAVRTIVIGAVETLCSSKVTNSKHETFEEEDWEW